MHRNTLVLDHESVHGSIKLLAAKLQPAPAESESLSR